MPLTLNATDHGRTIRELETIFEKIKSGYDGSSQKRPTDRSIDWALAIEIHDLFDVRTKRISRMLKRIAP